MSSAPYFIKKSTHNFHSFPTMPSRRTAMKIVPQPKVAKAVTHFEKNSRLPSSYTRQVLDYYVLVGISNDSIFVISDMLLTA